MNNKTNSWLYVKTDDEKAGWLYLWISYDPYEDGTWSILETITVQNKTWTVRKFVSHIIKENIWGVVDVRDKPGIAGTSILFRIQNDNSYESDPEIMAITGEQDTINGMTDYWLKIRDEKNRIGWLFGGYIPVYRGGPKYRIQEDPGNFNMSFLKNMKYAPPAHNEAGVSGPYGPVLQGNGCTTPLRGWRIRPIRACTVRKGLYIAAKRRAYQAHAGLYCKETVVQRRFAAGVSRQPEVAGASPPALLPDPQQGPRTFTSPRPSGESASLCGNVRG